MNVSRIYKQGISIGLGVIGLKISAAEPTIGYT